MTPAVEVESAGTDPVAADGAGSAGSGVGSRAGSGAGASKRGLRRRLSEWLVATLTIAALKMICALPEAPMWRIADLAGGIGYRVSGSRRDHARRNLRRVVEWMAANGIGEERYRRAATDPRALEGLVRAAFQNHIRSYVEMARAPRFTAAWVADRLVVETPEVVERWLTERRALILVGMHFGPIEMPGFYAVSLLGEVAAPMESVSNARIQRFLESTRGTIGVRILGLEDAGKELLALLRSNRPVGLIADRDLGGGGLEVELFGARTRIPAGPVVLAVETGAPIYVAGVRRTGPGRYRGNVRQVTAPEGLSRRERSRAMVRDEARLFELIVSDAPEQWLAVFHPIWPDLEASPGKPGDSIGGGKAGGKTEGAA